MELFYKENLVKKDESIIFDAEESHHLSKVLRKKVGEMISVTNGKGLEWHGQIVSADVRKAAAKKSVLLATMIRRMKKKRRTFLSWTRRHFSRRLLYHRWHY